MDALASADEDFFAHLRCKWRRSNVTGAAPSGPDICRSRSTISNTKTRRGLDRQMVPCKMCAPRSLRGPEMPHLRRDARSAIAMSYRDPVPKIHHTIASQAYVVRLVPPSTAKPPHRFDAGRKQLSIGACRRTAVACLGSCAPCLFDRQAVTGCGSWQPAEPRAWCLRVR
jgi:hypothetical protein